MTTSTMVSDVAPANRRRRREDTQLGYRLDVVGSDADDVVQSDGAAEFLREATALEAPSS